PCKAKAAKIGFISVDPQRIGVEDKEWRLRSEMRQGLHQRPAGIQQPVTLVRYDDARGGARGKMRDQHIGKVMHVDDRLGHARALQRIEPPVDQRPAAYWN